MFPWTKSYVIALLAFVALLFLYYTAQYAGPRKYASVDGDNVSSSNLSPSEYPFQPHKMDAATAAFIASCKEKEGATKKLPTIFKYNGDGKEVFVCGKFRNTFLR